MPDTRTLHDDFDPVAWAATRPLADGSGALASGFAQVAAAPARARVKSLEVTSTGDGKPPRVLARTWGNCGAVSAGTTAPSGPRAPTPPEVQAL